MKQVECNLGWTAKGWSLSPGRGKIFFPLHHLDLFWGPPNYPSSEYQGVKLASHLLVSMSRIHGSIHPLPHTS
jgi:hypothetical protein